MGLWEYGYDNSWDESFWLLLTARGNDVKQHIVFFKVSEKFMPFLYLDLKKKNSVNSKTISIIS